MMKQVELYFSDLNEKGQRKILEALSYSDPKDGNYDMDVCPIAILDYDMDVCPIALSEFEVEDE